MSKRRLLTMFVLAGIALLFAGSFFYFAGVRYNVTKSIPLGFYMTTNKTPTVGDYVVFCPPDNELFQEAVRRGYLPKGFCPGGMSKMMKQILAAKMDSIAIGDIVTVNGTPVPLSETRNEDLSGRPITVYRIEDYILTDREVLLMSDVSSTSFDARYFGPIDSKQIISVIKPLWTW